MQDNDRSSAWKTVSRKILTAALMALALGMVAVAAQAQGDAYSYSKSRDMQRQTHGVTSSAEDQYNLGLSKLQLARDLGDELAAGDLAEKKRAKLLKKFEKAVARSIEAFENVIREKDEWADAHAMIGLSHMEWATLRYNRGETDSEAVLERFEKARECFAKALGLAPDNQFAVWGKATIARLNLPAAEAPS